MNDIMLPLFNRHEQFNFDERQVMPCKTYKFGIVNDFREASSRSTSSAQTGNSERRIQLPTRYRLRQLKFINNLKHYKI